MEPPRSRDLRLRGRGCGRSSAQARTSGGLMVEQLGRAPAGNGLVARAQIVRGVAHVEVRTSDDRALVARATLVVPADPASVTPTPALAHKPQLVYPV
jgi:hypothetical protein